MIHRINPTARETDFDRLRAAIDREGDVIESACRTLPGVRIDCFVSDPFSSPVRPAIVEVGTTLTFRCADGAALVDDYCDALVAAAEAVRRRVEEFRAEQRRAREARRAAGRDENERGAW